MVSTLPLGSKFQPSSSFSSNLPLPVAAQVTGLRLVRMACCMVQQFASMNFPSGNTTLEASPIVVQPGGGASEDHLLVTGLYSAPSGWKKSPPLLYSPPYITTRPLGRTAEAK